MRISPFSKFSALPTLAILAALAGSAAGQRVITLPRGNLFDDPNNEGPLRSGQVYHVLGSQFVPAGKTLTIQPGAIVKFTRNTTLQVDGKLVCGDKSSSLRTFLTSDRDDTVCGEANKDRDRTVPKAGNWNEVLVNRGGDALIENTDLRYASGHRVVPDAAAARFEDCIITDTVGFGIDHLGGKVLQLDDVTIDNGRAPLNDVKIQGLPNIRGLKASGHTETDEVRMDSFSRIGTQVRVDPSMTANGSGVLMLEATSFGVGATGKLTLAAGMIVKGTRPIINVDGTLECLGTANRPVVFTAVEDDAFGGDSNKDRGATTPRPNLGPQRIFLSDTADASRFEHTLFRFAGSGAITGSLISMTRSSAAFTDCKFEHGVRNAIRMDRPSRPTIHRCKFENNRGIPLLGANLHALPGFAGNTATGNAAGDYFELGLNPLGSSGFGRLTIDPATYPGPVLVIEGAIRCRAGDELTIPPGTILKSAAFGGITIDGGKLNMRGTLTEPIIVTRLDDDSVGGDTTKNGNAPVGQRWGGINALATADTSAVEHAVLRHCFARGVDSASDKLTLRNVTVERSGSATAFTLAKAAGDRVENLVVNRAGTGIRIVGTSALDIVHATVTRCVGAGMLMATTRWTGKVRNSNVFGQGGVNFRGFSAGQVLSSNGGFAGQNGNIDADPKFRDAAGGDLRLQDDSPCVDAADLATGIAVGADRLQFPRVLVGRPNGAFRPDMGAFELAETGLEVAGTARPGGAVTFTNTGSPKLGGLFLGAFDTRFTLPGIGIMLVGSPATVLQAGPIPRNGLRLTLPNDQNLIGATFGAQSLTLSQTDRLALTDFHAMTVLR